MVIYNLLHYQKCGDQKVNLEFILQSSNKLFFFLFDVFIYLYLGLVGGDKTYKIEPLDPSQNNRYYKEYIGITISMI